MSLIPPKPKKKAGMPKLSIPSRPSSSSSSTANTSSSLSNQPSTSSSSSSNLSLSIPTSNSTSNQDSSSQFYQNDYSEENPYAGSTGSGFISTASTNSIYPDTVPGNGARTTITGGDGQLTMVADQSALTNDLRRAIGGSSHTNAGRDREREREALSMPALQDGINSMGIGNQPFLKLPVGGQSYKGTSNQETDSSSPSTPSVSGSRSRTTSTSDLNPNSTSNLSTNNENSSTPTTSRNGNGNLGNSRDQETPVAEIEPELILKGNLDFLVRLGEGASGEVKKVKHRPTGLIMAKKTISTSPNPLIHRQILRELSFNRTCSSAYIVKYYGAFLDEEDTTIEICMEFAEAGSLDAIYKKVKSRGGRTGEKVLAKIGESVLRGLGYLHERKIIHRDIKPSNIVVTRSGQIKLCDFGVSGELINSMAGTFTGTSYYMAPERIKGLPYSISSDVWSLGLTIQEIASNRFPFPPEHEPPLGPIDLLSYVVTKPIPELVDDLEHGIKWSRSFKDFIERCLEKDGGKRLGPDRMLGHPFLKKMREKEKLAGNGEEGIIEIARFVEEVWGWGTGVETPTSTTSNSKPESLKISISSNLNTSASSSSPSKTRQAPSPIITTSLKQPQEVKSTNDQSGDDSLEASSKPIQINQSSTARSKSQDESIRTAEERVEARLREADVGLVGSPTE